MNTMTRQALVALLSFSLVLLLLALVALSGFVDSASPARTSFVDIQLAAPPPPPPPAVGRGAEPASSPLDLSLAASDSPAMMLDVDLAVEIPRGQLPANGSGGQLGNDIDLSIDWTSFKLSELDGYPAVVQAPQLAYPKSLLAKGIHSFEVRLHIVIDETGRPYLVQILDLPYPGLASDIEKFVEGVRFTPPTLSGVAVKAEFIWPVLYNSR
ncbi:MAG: hypothetical protein RQ899_02180 [Pseudomonadales bacterium]|nr:hypothetical protein [Pseudomonadales bacterium]